MAGDTCQLHVSEAWVAGKYTCPRSTHHAEPSHKRLPLVEADQLGLGSRLWEGVGDAGENVALSEVR